MVWVELKSVRSFFSFYRKYNKNLKMKLAIRLKGGQTRGDMLQGHVAATCSSNKIAYLWTSLLRFEGSNLFGESHELCMRLL